MKPAPLGGLRRMPVRRKNPYRRFTIGKPMEHPGDFLSFLVAFPAQEDRIACARVGNRPLDGTDSIGVAPHRRPR